MQNVTPEYTQAMKLPLRNNSTAMVTIGDVNVELQTTAVGRDGGYESYWIYFSRAYYNKNDSSLFRTGSEDVYGTLEQNFVKADGRMLFPPKSTQTELFLDTGMVSRDVMTDSSNVQMMLYLGTNELHGTLTVVITFAETPPTRGSVSLWSGSNNVYKNFTSSDIVNNRLTTVFDTLPAFVEDYVLNITGYSDNVGRRMRVKNIVFGSGMLLDAEIVKNIETKYFCSRINEDLPTADATIDLLNYEARYDADNPDNPLAILDEEKQTVDIMYGYDVTGEGDNEWVHGGQFIVDTWSSDMHSAKIQGKDSIQNNDEPFVHDNEALLDDNMERSLAHWINEICGFGRYGNYDNLINVLYDADLWNMKANIPMPTLSRKECLQLIANFACKSMYVNREGVVVISSYSETTQDTTQEYTVTKTGGDTFDEPLTGTLSDTYDEVYAQVIPLNALVSGYKFNAPVDVTGSTWTFDPTDYDVLSNATVTIYGVKSVAEPEAEIDKDDIKDNIETEKEELIKSVIVPYYTEIYKPVEERGLGKNLFDMDNLEQGNVSNSGAFVPATNRVRNHDYVVLEEGTYTITSPGFQMSMMVYDPTNKYLPSESYSSWYNSPKTMTLEKKRNCIFIFRKSNDSDIDVDDLYNVQLEFGNASTTYEIYESSRSIWREEVEGDASGEYKLDVDLGSMYTNVKIRIDGRSDNVIINYADVLYDDAFIVGQGTHTLEIDAECETLYTSTNVVYPVNDTGKELEWKNPLVDTAARAEIIAEFVGEYLRSNISYDYDYRGNPEYDANDTILQENDFLQDMQVVITEHTITFDGGLKGHITARRRIE